VDGTSPEEASNRFLWFVDGTTSVGEALEKNVGLAETASKGTLSALRKHITRLQKVQAKTVDQEELGVLISDHKEHAQESKEARKPKTSQNADQDPFIVLSDEEDDDNSADAVNAANTTNSANAVRHQNQNRTSKGQETKTNPAKSTKKCLFEKKAIVDKDTPSDHDKNWQLAAAKHMRTFGDVVTSKQSMALQGLLLFVFSLDAVRHVADAAVEARENAAVTQAAIAVRRATKDAENLLLSDLSQAVANLLRIDRNTLVAKYQSLIAYTITASILRQLVASVVARTSSLYSDYVASTGGKTDITVTGVC